MPLGSHVTHRPVTTALARLTRCRVFSLDYRIAPEARFPAAFDDACAAYRDLVAAAVRHASPSLESPRAGGLVLALAMHARDSGLLPPVCVVALSPWTDLTGTGASIRCQQRAMRHVRTRKHRGVRIRVSRRREGGRPARVAIVRPVARLAANARAGGIRSSCCSTTRAGSTTRSSRPGAGAACPSTMMWCTAGSCSRRLFPNHERPWEKCPTSSRRK